MTLPFWVHPDASSEAEEAHDRYEAEAPGVGARFASDLDRTISLVCDAPAIGTPVGRTGRRRVVLEGFPYDVVYRVANETVRVLAVAHHRRRPGYFRSRA